MKKLNKLALKAKKNPKYFEKLYRETFDMAFKYFSSRVNIKADAEDLMQEFYLKLFRSLNDYDSSGSFYAFFYSIARSTYVDWLRKNIRAPLTVENIQERREKNEDFELSEKKMDIERSLKKLTEEEREILLLYFYDGLKNEEIAEILRISVENVKVKKHRALKKLREVMKGYGQA